MKTAHWLKNRAHRPTLHRSVVRALRLQTSLNKRLRLLLSDFEGQPVELSEWSRSLVHA